MKKYYSLVLLVCFIIPAFSQEIITLKIKGDIYQHLSVRSRQISDTILLPFASTSLSVSINPDDHFQNASILAGKNMYELKEDFHTAGEQYIYSRLIIFPAPVEKIIIYKPLIQTPYQLHCINSGKTPVIPGPLRTAEASNCGRPHTIDQSVWRSGLPNPVSKPVTSKVKHLVIHHSEGRNDTTTDFTYVVRQIYIFHTETRGWNDIGYNFLVAQNGDIYEGRDGQGLANEEDVVGAHLCGKNTETMGICLLGNYELVSPTEEALQSTKALLSWKLFKEKINPMGELPHPDDLLSPLFPQVAGHRDGCSTLCPGKYLYERLAAIRLKADTMVQQCGGVIPPAPITRNETYCATSEIGLHAVGTLKGFFRWYQYENDNEPLGTDSILSLKPESGSVTYYVSAINASGESSKSAVTATIINTTPPAVNQVFRIGEGKVTITASGGTNGNYRWYDDTTMAPLPGETSETFITPYITGSKTYYVSLYNGDCESAKIRADVDILPKLSPNPSHGSVTVAIENPTVKQVVIYDSQGRSFTPVFQMEYPLLKIDFKGINPGVYMLVVDTGNLWRTKVVIL